MKLTLGANLSRRTFAWLWSVCVAVAVASCASPSSKNRALKVLMESKRASLGDWEDLEIDGHPAVHLFRAKTAMLLSSAELAIKSHSREDGTLEANFNLALRPGAGVGSAVPVTRDGYFLTASHCLGMPGEAPQAYTLVAIVNPEEGELAQAPVRIVWRSPNQDDLDLAVVHAPVRPWQVFVHAPSSSYREGTSVAAAGWSGLFEGDPLTASAGRLRAISPPYGSAPKAVWRYLAHDAPLNEGDSGGPLVDRKGRLIGINFVLLTRTKGWLDFSARADQRLIADYRGFAVAPDPVWLRRVIAEDRRRER